MNLIPSIKNYGNFMKIFKILYLIISFTSSCHIFTTEVETKTDEDFCKNSQERYQRFTEKNQRLAVRVLG